MQFLVKEVHRAQDFTQIRIDFQEPEGNVTHADCWMNIWKRHNNRRMPVGLQWAAIVYRDSMADAWTAIASHMRGNGQSVTLSL